jgi:hypothetical protein
VRELGNLVIELDGVQITQLQITNTKLLLFFSGVFGASAGLRKVCIGRLQHGILVPMPNLALHGGVPFLPRFVLLNRTFASILIFHIPGVGHGVSLLQAGGHTSL